jgi:hypothetical protein
MKKIFGKIVFKYFFFYYTFKILSCALIVKKNHSIFFCINKNNVS